MSISSHLGIVILIIVGVATIFGVIIIAAIEARRMDKNQSPILRHTPETPLDKKKE
jgi:hypothetical protein